MTKIEKCAENRTMNQFCYRIKLHIGKIYLIDYYITNIPQLQEFLQLWYKFIKNDTLKLLKL